MLALVLESNRTVWCLQEESWPQVVSWILERLGPQPTTAAAAESGPAKL